MVEPVALDWLPNKVENRTNSKRSMISPPEPNPAPALGALPGKNPTWPRAMPTIQQRASNPTTAAFILILKKINKIIMKNATEN